MGCIFCNIIEGKMDADIIYQDDEVLAFRDIHPQAPQHVLIIPKHHYTNLNSFGESDALLLGKLMLAAKRVAQQLGVAEDGYRLNINTNNHGGQTVYHLHIHLLAGRQMTWPPG